jgi:type IV secretory pathway ATPase VirB11/archaellum biosynthesis ATPase
MAITLADLVANRTMSPAIAATLATAAAEKRSILVAAIPRLAGKTTTLMAALAHAPPGTPLHPLSRDAGPHFGMPPEPDGGYLFMAEISGVGFPEYLWGAEVRTVFERVARGGLSLATSLHAGSLAEAFEVIGRENSVPDQHASLIDLFVYIRSLGHWERPDRRVVAEVSEVDRVSGGLPEGRLLHRWDEATDRFEDIEPPERIGAVVDRRAKLTRFESSGQQA